MKDILGTLGLSLAFTIAPEDFKELVTKSTFKPRQPLEEGEFVARFRRQLAVQPEMEADTMELSAGGDEISVYSTTEKQAAFLRNLPAITEGTSIGPEDVLIYRYRLLNLVLDKSLIRASSNRQPSPRLAGLVGIINRNLIDAGYDLFGSDIAPKDWFHLTISPTNARVQKTSVRLIISKTELDDMIEAIKKVPAIVQAIETDLLES